jgi:hypothetical protein
LYRSYAFLDYFFGEYHLLFDLRSNFVCKVGGKQRNRDYFEDNDDIITFGNKKNDDSFIDMLLGAIISIIIIIIAVTLNLYGITS